MKHYISKPFVAEVDFLLYLKIPLQSLLMCFEQH